MKGHLAALAGALLLAAQSAALAQAGSKGAVRVGVLLPLTGNTAWAGKTNRIAAAIAAEEVNAQDLAGGYRIELVERFLGSNHIRRPRRVCRTKYGGPDGGSRRRCRP